MKHQQLMDQAYTRWQGNPAWSKQQFWNRLSFVERIAVYTGNLNNQVGNGGFAQWIDNGYSDCSSGLIDILVNEIKTDTSLRVSTLALEVLDLWENHLELCSDDYECSCYDRLDAMDRQYYKLSERFMADVQEWLDKQE